jgi:hypothetical protein
VKSHNKLGVIGFNFEKKNHDEREYNREYKKSLDLSKRCGFKSSKV